MLIDSKEIGTIIRLKDRLRQESRIRPKEFNVITDFIQAIIDEEKEAL